MARLSDIVSILSPVQIAFFTRRRGTLVGTDQFGNKYYTGRPIAGRRRERRWVIYAGEAEASAVPPEWHGWLHHQTQEMPSGEDSRYRQSWQKEHLPNLTGTLEAYRPPGHTLRGGERMAATGDYEAWKPE